MDLDRTIDDAPQRVRDVVLAHRDLVPEGLVVLDQVGGVEHHQLALVELHGGLGHLPLDALLVGEHAAVKRAVERALDGHLQRDLGVADPAHAMREPGRAEAHLAEPVALSASAEERGFRHHAVLDADLAVVALTGHRVDVAHDLPAGVLGLDDEGGVARLRRIRIGVGPGDHDGETRPVGSRDEPLVAVDHPVVTVLHG